MDGCGHEWRERGIDELGAWDGDAELWSDHGLRGGGAEADDGARLDHGDLRLKPRAARRNLGGVRFFVDAAFAARLPFEMLYDVRHVDGLAVDARFVER